MDSDTPEDISVPVAEIWMHMKNDIFQLYDESVFVACYALRSSAKYVYVSVDKFVAAVEAYTVHITCDGSNSHLYCFVKKYC